MHKFITVICLLFAVCAQANASWEVLTGNDIYPTTAATWSFTQAPQVRLEQAQSGSEVLPLKNLRLTVRDGKTQQEIALPAPQVKADGSTLASAQVADHLKVNQKLQLSASQGNSLLWTIEFENTGAEEAYIETGLGGSVDDTTELRFWDGYKIQPVGQKKIQRSTPLAAFPATMLQSSKQETALVIALHPNNDISWITTSLDPQQKSYFYGGRFTIPTQQKISLTYVLYILQPRFGELDAIDGYYQRFLSAFNAALDTDPRLTGFRGINSSYVVRHSQAEPKRESQPRVINGLGRLHASWDWSYNTYKFSGDWYGRAENWDLPISDGDRTALEKFAAERSSFDLHDLEQFHRDRIALYKKAELLTNTQMSFYLLNFAQAELAERNDWMKYSYGYFRPDDPKSGRIKRWVISYDDTWQMFPWATPFGDTYRRDLPQILKELETSSFAIDLYANSSPYRGPTTSYLPGWAYDEKGKFIDTGIANKRLVEFIHTLRKGKFRAAVVANLSPWETDPSLKTDERKTKITNYSTIFAPDAYVVEGDVSNLVDYDQPGRLFPKRYLFGKKYISSVSGAYHDQIGERIPWQTMSPNQIRVAYEKYLKKRLMAYYQGGILPNYDDARGIELLVNEIPRLLEIQSRGFSASPASTGNEEIQRRRYGDALGAAIVYSNPTVGTIQSKETLLNRYFVKAPNGVVLPFADDGKNLDFSVDKAAQSTEFTIDVPDMENHIVLLPIALQFSNPQNVQGSTRAAFDVHQQVYTLDLKLSAATKINLQVQPPRDFVVQEITLGNKKVDVTDGGRASLDVKLGESQLTVLFTSTQYLSTEQQFLDFNWKNFQIVVSGNENERKNSAAQILSDFATYYHKFTPAISKKDDVDLADAGGSTVIISTDAQRRGVRVDATRPGVLLITGQDDFDTQQLAWRLARLLDAHQPQLPPATFTNISTKSMLDRIGVMINAQNSAVAKPITPAILKTVPGEDETPTGDVGNAAQLGFERILPLPREGWTATASSSRVDVGNPIAPGKALDDVAGTRWTPGRGKAGAWLVVDMQEEREFNHVRLKSPYPYKYFPLHYRAELSDDGKNWRDPVTGEGAKDTEIYWPQLQKARYIRITLLKDQPEYWSIDEFLVYKRVLSAESAVAVPSLQSLPQLKVPRLKESPVIDGKLDEPFWQQAATFELALPLKDHPATQKTQVRIYHDGTAFYLGVICHEANMDKLWEPATTRDGAVWSGDDIEIYLAPGNHEGQVKFPYYQFLLSPSGVLADLKIAADGQGDLGWNGDWQVKTTKAADRWFAEIRLPFAMMEGEQAGVWRANIGRIEIPNGDTTTWAPMKRIFAQPHLFGVWEVERG